MKGRISSRAIVIALLLAGMIIILALNRGRLPFGKSQGKFAATPRTAITRIELSDQHDKLSLVVADGEWLVNGKHEIRKSGILFITRILMEMRIKSPVSPDMFRQEVTDKGISPVRVRVFEKKRLLSSFLVFRTSSNVYGNIMKTRENSKPFIVYVPGTEEDIGSVFTANELFWQPYTVFNLLPSEIASVTLENIPDTSASFRISAINGSWRLSGPGTIPAGWDSSRVRRYISYFSRVPFERWETGISPGDKAKIESGKPVYRIIVKKVDGEEITFTLWERYSDGRETRDTDRMLGKTSRADSFFIVRYFDIDPILKKRSYFFTG
jgi:hypothetical protein